MTSFVPKIPTRGTPTRGSVPRNVWPGLIYAQVTRSSPRGRVHPISLDARREKLGLPAVSPVLSRALTAPEPSPGSKQAHSHPDALAESHGRSAGPLPHASQACVTHPAWLGCLPMFVCTPSCTYITGEEGLCISNTDSRAVPHTQ